MYSLIGAGPALAARILKVANSALFHRGTNPITSLHAAASLFLPWRPWSTKEIMNAASPGAEEDLSDITVLIPARNEAEMMQTTLPAIKAQGRRLQIILVDDQSTDGTAQVARRMLKENLLIVEGEPLPAGWTGKLWALEQGRRHVKTPLTLLLDADIAPQPGIIVALRKAMKEKRVHFISLMAMLPARKFWQKLLLPADPEA